MKIDKPHGMVIEFWLYADTKDKLNRLLDEKQITKIDGLKNKNQNFRSDDGFKC